MKALLCYAFALLIFQVAHAATYTLHTVHSGTVSSRVRIVNLSDHYGVVEITGFDDQGEEYGPIELEMEAHASAVLLTRELENGAPDKGLLDGLGDGSGQWQLELDTDLEIAAVSFKSGVLSDVLSSAEPEQANGNLPEHFRWAHKLADKGLSLLGIDRHSAEGRATHELLSAYSWEPLDEVHDVIIGEGDYEHPRTLDAWKRFGGRLEYSFFAVHYGLLDGAPRAHAYTAGRRSDCQRPPENAKYIGAAVFVSEQGQFGYGVVNIETDTDYAAADGITTLTSHQFQRALDALRSHGLKLPHGFLPGSYPGGMVHVGESEEIWNSYQWNPPQYVAADDRFAAYAEFDPHASPKPSWLELVRASIGLSGGLVITATIYDKETGKSVLAEINENSAERLRTYGPAQQCLELGGRSTYNDGSYWAFGARRIEPDDSIEE